MSAALQTIPLAQIQFDPRNPRTDGAQGIEELAASLRGVGAVQPPILIRSGALYRVLVGERRVRAARAAGLDDMDCIISEERDPLRIHRARVAENLHRQPLNPIDHAVSLRVAWLLANAEALGHQRRAAELMSEARPISDLQGEIESLLRGAGFTPTAPAVTWDVVLNDLGVEMSAARRKKLINVLSLPPAIQEKLRRLPITQAGARALAALDEDAQQKITEAIEQAPDLARRARRIARAIRSQGYTVEEALAEARGEFVAAEDSPREKPGASFQGDQAAVDAVMRFLDASNQALSALQAVRDAAPDALDIPDPWRGYFQNALDTLREEVEE